MARYFAKNSDNFSEEGNDSESEPVDSDADGEGKRRGKHQAYSDQDEHGSSNEANVVSP